MDMIGKGPGNKGAVWVARKVPDGYISAHANAARIRQFPLNDPENTLYAPDVISFAREQGLVRRQGRGLQLRRHLRPADYGARALLRRARLVHVQRAARRSDLLPSDWVTGVDGRRAAAAVDQAGQEADRAPT